MNWNTAVTALIAALLAPYTTQLGLPPTTTLVLATGIAAGLPAAQHLIAQALANRKASSAPDPALVASVAAEVLAQIKAKTPA